MEIYLALCIFIGNISGEQEICSPEIGGIIL
jgi:hypothetical protein